MCLGRRPPVDFKYHLAETFRTERLKHGFAMVEELFEACRLSNTELMQLEIGKIPSIHVIFRLACFYKKRVRISLI
ncbi:MAG: hypothetical protein ACI4TE_04855 [Alphaproteobacteria bacterium]